MVCTDPMNFHDQWKGGEWVVLFFTSLFFIISSSVHLLLLTSYLGCRLDDWTLLWAFENKAIKKGFWWIKSWINSLNLLMKPGAIKKKEWWEVEQDASLFHLAWVTSLRLPVLNSETEWGKREPISTLKLSVGWENYWTLDHGTSKEWQWLGSKSKREKRSGSKEDYTVRDRLK